MLEKKVFFFFHKQVNINQFCVYMMCLFKVKKKKKKMQIEFFFLLSSIAALMGCAFLILVTRP